MFVSRRPRRYAAGAFAVLVSAAALTAPAQARPASPGEARTVAVQTVVDGVSYTPRQFRRFEHRALYSHFSRDGKTLISYTRRADFERFVRTQQLRAEAPRAQASTVGGYAKVCIGPSHNGPCKNVASGFGVASLTALDNCDFGCVTYENNVSTVQTFGTGAAVLLFDRVGFNFAGLPYYDGNPASVLYIAPNSAVSLGGTPWDDRASSIYVYW